MQRLAGRGFQVKVLKPSADVYPGVPLVAVIPTAAGSVVTKGALAPSGGIQRSVRGGYVPQMESANQGAGFDQGPMPVDSVRPSNAPGGVFTSLY